ncbi:MAG: efflux RND transporter periplasmic adaptor subunit [Chthoniobacteraceae bacterium]
MSVENPPIQRASADAFEKLDELRAFNGAPGEFWPAFLRAVLIFAPATDAVILSRSRSPETPGIWKDAFCWPPQSQLFAALKPERGEFERFTIEAEASGGAVVRERGIVAVRLVTGDSQRSDLLVVRLQPEANLPGASTRLRLLADVPLLYARGQALTEAREDLGRFAIALDLLVVLNTQTRFVGAAMLLCNELAARSDCERVSLGWVEGNHVRLQALSHTERFERKMELVAAIEGVMDEALDQDEEIVWPVSADCRAVVRSHETFARLNASGHLCSLPIRLDDAPVAVLVLERASREFTLREQQSMRLLCDHLARRFYELKRHDRWWGARLCTALREKSAHLVGPEHTGAKLAGIAVAVVLGVLLFGRMEYRVEAPFVLKGDVTAQLPAPFDGYLDEVSIRIGDPVEKDQPLLALDTRELLLREAAAIAERQKHLAEARKAESDNDVAEMRIAQASAEEAGARLDLARFQLQKAKVLAPFDGYVIEGDLRERLSSPVKQGEVLVKIAKLEQMYAEVAMPERDVHEIHPAQSGVIAFASQPQFTFPVRVERVEPVAEVREKGNVFVVRADFVAQPGAWWRPGMSGVCKVSVGPRNLLWIATHRTVDFLRLNLWWW